MEGGRIAPLLHVRVAFTGPRWGPIPHGAVYTTVRYQRSGSINRNGSNKIGQSCFLATISNENLISSFSFSAPPATETGLMP
jgi:hypothetical protein